MVGIGFFVPGLAPLLGIKQPESLFFVWSPALLVTYLGVLLILCSRDLSRRGTLVYWEGIPRVGWWGSSCWAGLAISAASG